jgi:hypothetical protein
VEKSSGHKKSRLAAAFLHSLKNYFLAALAAALVAAAAAASAEGAADAAAAGAEASAAGADTAAAGAGAAAAGAGAGASSFLPQAASATAATIAAKTSDLFIFTILGDI